MKRLAPLLAALLLGSVASASAFAAEPSKELEQQWALASQPAVKLVIGETGWYRIGSRELEAAGISRSVDPALLRLYAEGRELPLHVSGVRGKRFGAGGAIEFYALARSSPTDDTRTYWLLAGSERGRRIPSYPAGSARGQTPPSFPFTVSFRPRENYFSALRNGDRENWFGPLVRATPLAHSFTLGHLDPKASALLTATLQGVSLREHRVRVTLNGEELGSAGFGGQARKTIRIPLPGSLLREGENLVTLASTAGDTDMSLLDSLALTYGRRLRAEADELRFPVGARHPVTVVGFSKPDVRVLDVTDAARPALVIPRRMRRADGYAIKLGPSPNSRRLLAMSGAKLKHPRAIVRDRPSSWHKARGADLVLIGPASLLEATKPLQQVRERQGLKVVALDVQDLYDEFAFGAHGPEAIKSFLARAREHWQPAPRFVLLVGDASNDPRNYSGRGAFDLVPTKLVDTAIMEAPSDDWLADFDGDGAAELALGRLPVRSVAQTEKLVAKIIRYETQAGDASNTALVVSDDASDWDFQGMSTAVTPAFPAGFSIERINQKGSPSDAALRTRIVAALNRGPGFVTYYGHGSVTRWSGFFTSAESRVLQNTSLSVFFLMTCLNGYFVEPGLESMAEALLLADNGAVSVWASGGETLPLEYGDVSRFVLANAFSPSPWTLGEAIVAAKAKIRDADVRKTWTFFGDPSMKLRYHG